MSHHHSPLLHHHRRLSTQYEHFALSTVLVFLLVRGGEYQLFQDPNFFTLLLRKEGRGSKLLACVLLWILENSGPCSPDPLRFPISCLQLYSFLPLSHSFIALLPPYLYLYIGSLFLQLQLLLLLVAMVLAAEYFWVGICVLGFLHLGALARLHPAATFDQNYVVTGGTDDHVNKLNGGQTVQLVLDQASASGFASRNKYLFGHIGMKIKLVPKDSAGTVTAFYTSSETSNHDELDFEFLGNTSGQPYILQTNVFANGIGQREQRMRMWFDPTADFHQYSVIWNKQQIIFEVDDVPIRVFKNNEALGMPYLSSQPMRIFSSLWNGDSWATRGGLQKLNWTHSPFVATYQSFSIDACEWNSAGASNSAACAAWAGKQWWNQGAFQTQLDSSKQSKLKWVQQNYMIYNYCNDKKRFTTPPLECTLT